MNDDLPNTAPDSSGPVSASASGMGPAPPPRPERRGRIAPLDVILALDLMFLAFAFLSGLRGLAGPPVREFDVQALWFNSALLLVLGAAVPLLWAWDRYGDRFVAWLRLRGRPIDVLEGIAWVVVIFVIVGVTAYLEHVIRGTPLENPATEGLGRVMTWPLAIFMAASAALGEEVLFRGVLMRWFGGGWRAVAGQALLFGLAHAGYGTVVQVVAPLIIGVLFGALVLKGRSLWVVIVAHFVYDLVALSTSLWLPS